MHKNEEVKALLLFIYNKFFSNLLRTFFTYYTSDCVTTI